MRKKRNEKKERKTLLFTLFILIIVISIVSIFLNFKDIVEETRLQGKNSLENFFISKFYQNYSKIEFPLLAIDENGEGKITKLVVEVKNGSGKILVNIENLLFWVDTQNSIRIAKNLAERISKVNTSTLDIIYTIEANASIIGGPSAGSAITIATIAALTQKEFRKDVVITGTIDEFGNIGKVSAIKEKCLAAKKNGAKICIVPKGQGKIYELIPQRDCTQIGNFEFCKISYKAKEVDISKEIGINIVEISNIEEALRYFFFY